MYQQDHRLTFGVDADAYNKDVADIDVEQRVVEEQHALVMSQQQVVDMLVGHNSLDIESNHSWHKLEQHYLFQKGSYCQHCNVDNIADSMLVALVFGIDSKQRIVDQLKHEKQELYREDIAAIGAVVVVAVAEVAEVAVEEQEQQQQQQ